MHNVGFVGLGMIGEPMAATLLRAGYVLTICGHTNMEPVERLRAQGARVVAAPRDVAAASDIVVVCVPDAPQVEEVCLGDAGLVHGAAAGMISWIAVRLHRWPRSASPPHCVRSRWICWMRPSAAGRSAPPPAIWR